MELKAVFNNVIVKPLDEEEILHGSIIVPDIGKEKGLVGTIVDIGEGFYTITGTFIKTTLHPGQKVYLPPIGPSKIEHNGQEYWCCQENQILAIINN